MPVGVGLRLEFRQLFARVVHEEQVVQVVETRLRHGALILFIGILLHVIRRVLLIVTREEIVEGKEVVARPELFQVMNAASMLVRILLVRILLVRAGCGVGRNLESLPVAGALELEVVLRGVVRSHFAQVARSLVLGDRVPLGLAYALGQEIS